jgi:hypothetical protein
VASEEERKRLEMDPSEQIEINLFDGSTVRVDPYHYLEVSEPTDFIFGVGEQLDRSTGKYKPFRGKIFGPYVDSTDTVKHRRSSPQGPGSSANRAYNHFIRLPDSSTVCFEPDDFIAVKSDQGPGLWCAGHKTVSKLPVILLLGSVGMLIDANGDAVNGRIPFDQIKSIEVRKFSTLKTVLWGAGTAAEVGFFIALSSLHGLGDFTFPSH